MLSEFTLEFVFHFMLVFARLGAAFSYFPAIGSNYIPIRAKLALALLISLIIIPIVAPYLPKYSDNFIVNISYLAIEILIGVIVSLAANIYFQALHMVGQVIVMQSGLGSATFYDPLQHEELTFFSNFMFLMAIAAIFSTNTHYLFIQAIIDSYSQYSPGELLNLGDVSKFVSYIINDSFILSFKLSAPFLIVSLAILMGKGLLARIIPNFQVFFVLMPAQILVILAILYLVINPMINKLLTVIINSLNI